MIEAGHERVSVARQCALLGLSRSSYYYRPRPPDPFDLELMHTLDRLYTRYPFYGVRRLEQALRHEGYAVNVGSAAIPVRRRLSAGDASHRIYPYLLRRRVIDQPPMTTAAAIDRLVHQRYPRTQHLQLPAGGVGKEASCRLTGRRVRGYPGPRPTAGRTPTRGATRMWIICQVRKGVLHPMYLSAQTVPSTAYERGTTPTQNGNSNCRQREFPVDADQSRIQASLRLGFGSGKLRTLHSTGRCEGSEAYSVFEIKQRLSPLGDQTGCRS